MSKEYVEKFDKDMEGNNGVVSRVLKRSNSIFISI